MTEAIETPPWERLEALAQAGDARGLETYVESIGPSEVFRALLRLEPQARERVLTTLSPEDAADLIEEIPEEHAADLIEDLEAKDAASIVSEMDSDDQVDVLANLDPADAEAILARMPPEDARHARTTLPYPRDVAGGLMVTEYLSYADTATVRDVIEDLNRRTEEGLAEDLHAYVVSGGGRLIGTLDLRDLVLARRDTLLAQLLKPSAQMKAEATLDELEAFFDREHDAAVPVVDAHQALLGVVRREDVAEELAERAENDHRKMQGIVGGDEIRSLPVTVRSRRRLSWLSVNILLNIIAASVIAAYEETLAAVIALAVFLPIVSDMSGCSGNQAVAVSIRELSLGITKPFELLRVWLQEVKVGLINGVVLGALLALAAILWKGNPWLGLVVGGALAANTLVAVSIGGTVPLVLKRLKLDPAVASGPILTTVTDMCGFFLVLSFAAAILPRLTA
ncbi:MAG: magnesium transporter [Betaproteobacteria bacterium]|nr:magnesium transporter [Betaproteobacteria bacterium]MDH5578873.1 magnesium transporter [Betaproteobacteria bacterium]